jgi:SAM-dependent methyltransferase
MNAWSNPDAISVADAQRMALFLEERAGMPDQARLHAALVAAFAPQPGEHLLDLGCGTGVIARRLATAVGTAGSVLGVDVSTVMVQMAQARANHPALRFTVGDAANLAAESASFDGATAVRLLLHVPDPQPILHELQRVVRSGGRLGLLEWDWGTIAIDHSNRELTRRILDWRCDQHGGNNWMGRQLVRRCQEAGWIVRDIHVLASIYRNADLGFVATLRRAAEGAYQHHTISDSEYTAWIAELDTRLAEGRFFATVNDYLVIADRPA